MTPRDRRRAGRPVHPPPVLPARGRPPPAALTAPHPHPWKECGMAAQEIRVPDIGDFTDVPIIEILVNPGDTVAAEDPLLTLESDKATWTCPRRSPGRSSRSRSRSATRCRRARSSAPSTRRATPAGVHRRSRSPASLPWPHGRRRGGERRRTPRGPDGTGRVRLVGSSAERARPGRCTRERPTPYTGAKGDVHAKVLVLGAGPGGYTAAFRAADLGKKVVMVDSRGPLGGVCPTWAASPRKRCCTRRR